jgi:hypothetical protein
MVCEFSAQVYPDIINALVTRRRTTFPLTMDIQNARETDRRRVCERLTRPLFSGSSRPAPRLHILKDQLFVALIANDNVERAFHWTQQSIRQPVGRDCLPGWVFRSLEPTKE